MSELVCACEISQLESLDSPIHRCISGRFVTGYYD
jgi:hypothetical protein